MLRHNQCENTGVWRMCRETATVMMVVMMMMMMITK
jgi:hypothetical protein